jgi:hypothetical protein
VQAAAQNLLLNRRHSARTNYGVTRPISRCLHASFSLVALAAWLLASNHCAVANFIPAPVADAPAEHSHCQPASTPAEPADEQPANDCDGSKCCGSLSAPLALAKNPVSYDALAFSSCPFANASCTSAGEDHHLPILELDTGPPPEHCSFAEIVLQRSILAHAPPAFA